MAKKKDRISAKTVKAMTGGLPKRQVVRIGRNQPCPCGSEKKYKDCHATEGETFLQDLARRQEKERLLAEQKRLGVPWYKRLLTRLSK